MSADEKPPVRLTYRAVSSISGDKAHGAAFFAALYYAKLLLVLVLRRRGRLGQSLVERGNALPHAFKIVKLHSSHRCIICRHLKKRQRCEIIPA